MSPIFHIEELTADVLVRHNSPTRVMLQRIIVNGTEASSVARDQLAKNFGYGALKGKKNTVK